MNTWGLITILFLKSHFTFDGTVMNVFDARHQPIATVETTVSPNTHGKYFYLRSVDQSHLNLATALVDPGFSKTQVHVSDALDRPMGYLQYFASSFYIRGEIRLNDVWFNYEKDEGFFGRVTYRIFGQAGTVLAELHRSANREWELKMLPGFEALLDPSMLIFMATIRTWQDQSPAR